MGNQNRPPKRREFDNFQFGCLMVPRWLQDRPKRAPGVSWAVLGPSWGGLGPLLEAVGSYLGGLGARFGSFWGRFGVRFVDSIHRFDSMMRFVVSIR